MDAIDGIDNRRVASLSSFFKYPQVAAEMRLPITVPNPARAQFLGRDAAGRQPASGVGQAHRWQPPETVS